MQIEFKKCKYKLKRVKKFQHRLHFYQDLPLIDVDLKILEEVATDRFLLLVGLNNTLQLTEYIQENNLNYLLNLRNNLECQIDEISHHILALTFCQDFSEQKWFMARELELFKLKFSSLSDNEVDEFLIISNNKYKPISSEDKINLFDNKMLDYFNIKDADELSETVIYKVPYNLVLPLLKSKQIYLNAGYAYILKNDIVYVLMTKFHNVLHNYLKVFLF